MKVDAAPIKDIPVLEVLPKHADWLKETFPSHYRVLMQMIREGRAVILTDSPQAGT